MSRKNSKPLKLKTFIPYQLSVVTNKISTAFARLYSERFDLSVHEWRVMAVLGEQPRLSADQVCAATEMDKVTVSRAVARLLEKKLLDRSYAPEDKRRSVLTLTTTGHAAYSRIVPLALQFEQDLEQALSKAELKQLQNCLAKLNGHADGLQ
ncbi:MAG: MarR family winged helix-turn-helix transcriptional regulator [Gammaproteobacteria bacterium]